MPLTNGFVVMTPTSISSTGTGNSSSINSDGSVSFSSCATLSLNGVFTSSYDNYMIVWMSISTSAGSPLGRLRASGTDATASQYFSQYKTASSTTVSAARDGSALSRFNIAGSWGTSRSGFVMYVFAPQLSVETTGRTVIEASGSDATFYDFSWTHSAQTSYDGLTFTNISDSGVVTVFGFNQ